MTNYSRAPLGLVDAVRRHAALEERSISWTLDIETAKKFAIRLYGRGVVLMAVAPEAVRAYVDSRKEQECLFPLLPNKAEIQIVQKLKQTDVIGAAGARL